GPALLARLLLLPSADLGRRFSVLLLAFLRLVARIRMSSAGEENRRVATFLGRCSRGGRVYAIASISAAHHLLVNSSRMDVRLAAFGSRRPRRRTVQGSSSGASSFH